MNWGALIRQILQGEPAAGPILVSVVAPVLDQIAIRQAPDLSQAAREECVERALCGVVEKIDQYKADQGSLLSWSRGFLARELALCRRQASDSTDPVLIDEMPAMEARADVLSPEAVALTDLVARLSIADQALLDLHIQQGMSFVLIADSLGPPTNPVALRKRYQRAREKVIALARDDQVLAPLLESET